jgi:hypothetical protein
MDGMNYIARDMGAQAGGLAKYTIGRAVTLTALLTVVVLAVLIGLRLAGFGPLIGDEIAFAPIGA